MAKQDFAEKVDTVAVLRSILDSYPFSVGVLREFIQNSDDARATKQIFILDRRSHDFESCEELSAGRGPSLIAYNDKVFQEADWEALQKLHVSSKTGDSSKIGKYGIGFRSGYHVTDTPQILSGSSIAYLDPQQQVFSAGGSKLDGEQRSSDHISSFESPCLPPIHGDHYAGTIVRLPLRRKKSKLGDKVLLSTIRTLFDNLIAQELEDILLFLNHVTSVEVYDIAANGKVSQLARVAVYKEPCVQSGPHSSTACNVTSQRASQNEVTTRWRVVRSQYGQDYTSSFNQGFLERHKMRPEMGVAVCLSPGSSNKHRGRLYTYLPLPVITGFPIHVHGLFALVQSRQDLRNAKEIGVVADSDDGFYVQWNQYLFDKLLPESWVALICSLISNSDVANVFELWPPANGQNDSYWRNIVSEFVKVASNHPVWPTISSEVTGYVHVAETIIARHEDESSVAMALAEAGVSVTCVPSYIYDIMEDFATYLVPEIAREALLEADLVSTSQEAKALLLEYLVSTQNIANIQGLPLIPSLGGGHIALGPRKQMVFVLLDKSELEVFSPFDRQAIALSALPKLAANLLRDAGQRDDLNVRVLDATTVIQYLQKSNALDLDVRKATHSTKKILKWVAEFWRWFDGSSWKDRLFPQLGPLFLLPTKHALSAVERGLYVQKGIHPATVDLLEPLQFPFIDPSFPSGVNHLLSAGVVRDCDNLCDVLQSLRQMSYFNIPSSSQSTLLRHFLLCHQRRQRDLNAIEQDTVFRLTIYPLIRVDPNNGVSTPFVDGVLGKELVVIRKTDCPVLPHLSQSVYLDVSHVSCADRHGYLLSLLDLPQPKSYLQVLHLGIPELANQHISTQRALIGYLLQHRDALPPNIITRLSAPRDIINPSSDISFLYDAVDHPSQIPLLQTADEKRIIRDLGALGILTSALTVASISSYIQFLASQPHFDLALEFLRLVNESRLDLQALSVPQGAGWLPAESGELVSVGECREDSKQSPRALFDRVLHVLDKRAKLGTALRRRLGWEAPVSMSIIEKQLEAVLAEARADVSVVQTIITELSSRLDSVDVQHIQNITVDNKWIPINDSSLAATSGVVLSRGDDWKTISAFFDLPWTTNRQVRQFLFSVGCVEEPSAELLIAKLNELATRRKSKKLINTAVSILEILPDLTDSQLAHVLVPDSSGTFCRISELYYNDVNELSHHDLDATGSYAHPLISQALADKLGIKFLGLNSLQLEHLPIDNMGEELKTRIRNTLLQYTIEQMLPEFLANAADAANTTSFQFLLDERHGPTDKLLSEKMKSLQTCPALLIYNDGLFEEKDFQGLIRIGTGGKEDRGDTIGQFGSGALTMFHVSECPMIISGDKVLFVDPCQRFFPGHFKKQNVVLCRLESVKLLYPDHVEAVNGLFGFDMSTSFYPGTIFRLPLRQAAHVEDNSGARHGLLLEDRNFLGADQARRILSGSFYNNAQKSLIFLTSISRIVFATRDSMGNIRQEWTVESTRELICVEEAPTPDDILQLHSVTISSTDVTGSRSKTTRDVWRVARMHSHAVPEEFHDLKRKHRLRSTITTGLAYRISSTSRSTRNEEHNFFSTLPLPIAAALPVHLSAPFILAPDRRSIRTDDFEAGYNHWLLQELIPTPYLFLVEELLQMDVWDKSPSLKFWPGGDEAHAQEPVTLSSRVTDAFYRHLSNTQRKVFSSYYEKDLYLPPSGVLMLPSRKPTLKPTHIVDVPTALYGRITRESLKEVLDLNADLFIEQYHKKDWEAKVVADCSLYLLGPEDPDEPSDTAFLVGLPLLPLANGRVTRFCDRDTAGEMRYMWRPLIEENTTRLFPAEYIVDPSLMGTAVFDRIASEQKLNVEKLSASGLQYLLRMAIGREQSTSTEISADWLSSFWLEFPGLRKGFPDTIVDIIQGFPLVRTIGKQTASIKHCQSSTQLLLCDKGHYEKKLLECFSSLGAMIISQSVLPVALQEILEDESNTFCRFLAFAERHVTPARFQRFIADTSASTLEAFVAWARYELRSFLSTSSSPKRLPIWLEPVFSSAEEICMLPSKIFMSDIKQFINRGLAPHELILERVLDDVWASLALPQGILTHLVRLWLRFTNGAVAATLPMPNTSTLYARDPLFVASLGPTSFFEDSLPPLRREQPLNPADFVVCASAIDADFVQNKPGIVERATEVFAYYQRVLPLYANQSSHTVWQQLEMKAFIPRDYVQMGTLPRILSPSQALLPKYEGVAWSQRCVVEVTVDETPLLLVNRDFGSPSVDEVVRHLRVLALEVAVHAHANAGQLLMNYHSDKIFLNVDDPARSIWRWCCADEMCFNIADDATTNTRAVMEYLAPFKRLLVSSGVHEIVDAPVPQISLTEDATILLGMRQQFDNMRRAQRFTDVAFVASDASEHHAHRSFMASQYSHFDMLFGDYFAEGSQSQAGELVRVTVGDAFEGSSVSAVIGYVYTRSIADDMSLDTLLEVTRLSLLWGLTELSERTQQKVIVERMITPETYRAVENISRELDAQHLIEACSQYWTNNRAVIQRHFDMGNV
ncbi:hypothetical protein BDZ89DRAFT_1057267 [Hymenopellis radicata]|nr:hypothetical protein BDZ89DRAFT_1057267 [Hymenopellis radicata]